MHVVALVRAGFYGSYNPYYVSIPYVLVVAGSLFVIGAYPPAPPRQLADRELSRLRPKI